MMKTRNILLGILILTAGLFGIALAKRKDIGKSRWFIRLWATLWKPELGPNDRVIAVRGWMWTHYTPESPLWRQVNKLVRRLKKKR